MALDLRGAMNRLGNDVSLFEEFIGFYREDYPRLAQALRTAVLSNNPDAIHHAAHSIKGLVASLGATEVVAAANTLERMGRVGDVDDVRPALEKLETEVRILDSELADFRNALPKEMLGLLNGQETAKLSREHLI